MKYFSFITDPFGVEGTVEEEEILDDEKEFELNTIIKGLSLVNQKLDKIINILKRGEKI